MENGKFKFEPVWLIITSMLPVGAIYSLYKMVMQPTFKFNPSFLILVILPVVAVLLIFPMTIKMLAGIPAIQLTQDQLINHISGVTIDWANVKDIRITGKKKPFLSIILKDVDSFYASIRNPLKRRWLKFFYSLSTGDVSINLAFVAGDNDTIEAYAQAYRNRYYGITD